MSVVVCVWIIAAVSAVHHLLSVDTRQLPAAAGGGNLQYCVRVTVYDPLYAIVSFVMWYAGPLAVMTVVYIRISVVLWKSSVVSSSSSSVRGGSDHTTSIELQTRTAALNVSEIETVRDPDSVERGMIPPHNDASTTGGTHGTRLTNNPAVVNERRKVVRLLVAVVVSFAVCLLPYNVKVIRQTVTELQVVDDWHVVIPPLIFVAYYLNSAVNPLLYALLSERFRSSLGDVLRGRCTRRSQTTLTMTIATRCAAASRTVRTATAAPSLHHGTTTAPAR